MEKIELIDTGRLTEKQARLNMEKCAEFLARMIQKYGDVVLGRLVIPIYFMYGNRMTMGNRNEVKI